MLALAVQEFTDMWIITARYDNGLADIITCHTLDEVRNKLDELLVISKVNRPSDPINSANLVSF